MQFYLREKCSYFFGLKKRERERISHDEYTCSASFPLLSNKWFSPIFIRGPHLFLQLHLPTILLIVKKTLQTLFIYLFTLFNKARQQLNMAQEPGFRTNLGLVFLGLYSLRVLTNGLGQMNVGLLS